MLRVLRMLPAALLAIACQGPAPENQAANVAIVNAIDEGNLVDAPVADPALLNDTIPPIEPLPPGNAIAPAGRASLSEASFSPTSAQGAANVVQTYYALLEARQYDQAYALWSDGGKASGMSEAAFAASFDIYDEYHANVGPAGRVEGAAGSLHVEVPVQVYGRLKRGGAFNMRGPLRLRRVNDVPGSTAEQRRWHIAESGIRPRP